MSRLAARLLLVPAGLALGLAALLTTTPAAAQTPAATVQFLNVGQGDAVLIRAPEGKIALIDAGPSAAVVPLLRALGVTTIDLVAVSHHHQDHYGGLDDVIREFGPPVFLASASSYTSPQYLRLLQLVRDEGLTPVLIEPGRPRRRIELGSVILTIMPLPPEDLDEENNNSLGIRVQHGRASVLLTGDSEEPERNWWMSNPEAAALARDVDALKLAHHGSVRYAAL